MHLFHQLGYPLSAVQLRTGQVVKIGSELRERSQLTILGKSQSNTTTQLLDYLGLGCATDAGNRKTCVNSRPNARIEHVRVQEDLAIGNRDHVGRYEGRDVTRLGFNNRQRGQGTGLAGNLSRR